MNDCPIFFVDPETLDAPIDPPPAGPTSCQTCCNCGYVQYESLLPYLAEIKHLAKFGQDEATELEMRLRSQILEISRLFDIQAGVAPGYFSKSHYDTTKVYPTNGSRYIKVPDHVAGTLEVRTMGNHLISDSAYAYRDGFLIHYPCLKHTSLCSCSNSGCTSNGCNTACREANRKRAAQWRDGCYQITAKWGHECADSAVQMAIRDYLIETYRVQDPIVLASTGLPVSRTFRVPHSWATYITNFKAKRDLYSKFAFA